MNLPTCLLQLSNYVQAKANTARVDAAYTNRLTARTVCGLERQ